MAKCKHALVRYLIWLWLLGLNSQCQGSIRNQFDFDPENFDQTTLKWENNGIGVILEDQSQYDSEHHRIRFDGQYQANITGVLDHSTSGYEYYVGIWMYMYDSSPWTSPFCLKIKAKFEYSNSDCPVGCDVFWCSLFGITSGVTRVHSYAYFKNNTDVIIPYMQFNHFSILPTGWQFFGFYHHAFDASAVPDYASGKHKFEYFSSQSPSSTLQMTDIDTLDTSAHRYYDDPSLGYLNYAPARQFKLLGLISKLVIHDEIPATSEVSTRADVLTMIDTYSYFWSFAEQDNNGWHSDQLSNQGYNYQGILTESYFINIDPLKPPYPSNKGWFLFISNTYIRTTDICLNYSSQFTIEMEVFPFSTGHVYSLTLFGSESEADLDAGYVNLIQFSNSQIDFVTPVDNFSLIGIGVTSFKWSKVYVTWQLLKDPTQVEICFYFRVLVCDGCTGGVHSSTCSTQSTIDYFPSLETVVARIHLFKIILRSFKIYNYALSTETISEDLDTSLDALTNEDDDFTQEFENNYFDQYFQIAPNLDVSDEDNACMKYITPSTLCYSYDSANPGSLNPERFSTEWSNGEPYMFQSDSCGDGFLEDNPQTLQCDDGNSINGDGCSSQCSIEQDYGCIRLDNGTSYCSTGCPDGIKATNEECDDDNDNNGDGCNNICFIEDGYQCDITISPNSCYPLCGDGQRIGDEECDDNNDFDYDGCDSQCKVETSYTCTPDSGLGRDVCTTDYYSPIVTDFKLNTRSSEAKFSFNDTMEGVDFSEGDIIITVSGPNEPYSVSWTASFIEESVLKVKFSVSPGILGGIGEVLEITLANVERFVSKDHIPLANPAKFTHYYSSVQPSAQAEAAGKGASYSYLLTMGISIGVTLLTGGSMELMWSMTNTLQIIYYMSLLRLYFYPDLRVMLRYMAYSDFENPLTTLLSDYAVDGASLVPFSENSRFEGTKIESHNILANALDKILWIALMFLLMIFFFFLVKCIKTNTNWITKRIWAIDMRLRYESTSRFLTELSLNLFVVCILNITYGRDESLVNIIGFGISTLLMILMLFTTLYSLVYPVIHFIHIKIYPDYNERHCFLFLGFKKTHLKCYLYYGHFLVRRLGLALAFVCLVDFVEVQCICLLIVCGWIAEYHCLYKPFKNQVVNFLSCTNEMLLTAFCCILFGFISNSNPNRIMFFGYTGMGVLAVFFIVNWCVIIPIKLTELFKSIKECFSKKKEKTITKPRKFDSQLSSFAQGSNIATSKVPHGISKVY